MNKLNPYSAVSYESLMWDYGYEQGKNSIQHPDQEIQDEWTKQVLNQGETYDYFMAWRNGYLVAKKID